MQAAHLLPPPDSDFFLWSVSERRFALLVQSVNGLRFAHPNSQTVGVLRVRRPSLCFDPIRLQRAMHCESHPRFAHFNSSSARHVPQPASVERAASVRFGHQRPNPSIEGMHKRLRLLCTPHVKR